MTDRKARARTLAPRKAPPKRAVNLTLDAGLLAEAKSFGTNLSQVLEAAVKAEHREKRWANWREANRDPTESMNAYVKKNGLWSKKLRTW